MAYEDDKIKHMAASFGLGNDKKHQATEQAPDKVALSPVPRAEAGDDAQKGSAKNRTQKKSSAKPAADDDFLKKAKRSEIKSRHVNIAVSPSTYEAWKSKADAYGLSMTQFITEVVNEYLGKLG